MKKLFKILGILILALVLVFTSITLIHGFNIKKSKAETKEFIDKIKEVEEKTISYALIEINPKAILEIVNNKVTNISCLNEDCTRIFNIDINGKGIADAIELLYNAAKNSGVSIQNGVSVSSTNKNLESKIQGLDYVNYNTITKDVEKELLSQIKDDEEISKNQSNYNVKMLELYKQDQDYGTIYTCDIINNELECYITEDFYNSIPAQPSIFNIYNYNSEHQKLMNVLEKFNIQYEKKDSSVEGFDLFKIIEIKSIDLNDQIYNVGFCYVGDNNEVPCVNDIIIEEILESGEYGYLYKALSLTKLNLISGTYEEKEIKEYRNYQSTVITGPGQEIN